MTESDFAIPYGTRFLSQEHLHLLGRVLPLFLCSSLHRTMTFSDVERLIVPPILQQQCRFYIETGDLNAPLFRGSSGTLPPGRLVGFVSWALMSGPDLLGYLTGNIPMRESQWLSGNRIVVMDFLAPFGHSLAMARDLRQLFKGKQGVGLRYKEGHRFSKVCFLQGSPYKTTPCVGHGTEKKEL